jgi:predicted transcriptional regulator
MPTTSAGPTILVHIHFPRELHGKLWDVARAEDRSLSAEVRRACAAHVERHQNGDRARHEAVSR